MILRALKDIVKYSCVTKLMGTLTISNSTSMAFCMRTGEPNLELEIIDNLRRGDIVALPTDTVYGLACSATNSDAIKKLYQIKARNENKPLAICVGEVSHIQQWAVVDHLPEGLLQALLPGPVTLVLNCSNELDQSLSLHGKVGVRIPDYSLIRQICDGLNCPLALTSANVSDEPSSVKIEEFMDLWPEIDRLVDGGNIGVCNPGRAGSTVFDLSEPGFYKIIRQGINESWASETLKSYGLKAV